MTDIVERLRYWHRQEHPKELLCLGDLLMNAADEIERLREYIALKDGWATPGIYNFKTDLGKALAENAKLREALEKIAHPPSDIDAGYYPIAYARAALQKDEG